MVYDVIIKLHPNLGTVLNRRVISDSVLSVLRFNRNNVIADARATFNRTAIDVLLVASNTQLYLSSELNRLIFMNKKMIYHTLYCRCNQLFYEVFKVLFNIELKRFQHVTPPL